VVFFQKKNRPHQRFYLLPGQGGKNYIRKQRFFLRWAVLVALVFGALLGLVMWWLSRLNLWASH
jgi:hypothetical protein